MPSNSKTKTKKKPVSHRKQTYKVEYSKKWTCIASSGKGEFYARCTMCTCNISIAHGGASDIKLHMQSLKHRSASQDEAGSSTITKILLPQDNTTIRAETLMTQFIIEHNLPMAVADHLSILMIKMFPDSKIAEKFACRRTKITALAQTLGQETRGWCNVTFNDLLCVHYFHEKPLVKMFT